MKFRTKFAAVVIACFAMFGVTAVPAQAVAPGVFLIPASAAVSVAEVGVVATAATVGFGLSVIALGAYAAWSGYNQIFNVKVPYQSGSLSSPVSRPYQDTLLSSGSTLHYFRSGNGSYSTWTYQSVSFVGASYTDTLGNAVILASPRYTSQGADFGSANANMACGISVKNISTGVVTNDMPGNEAFSSNTAPFQANMSAVDVPACDLQIQHAITQAGVDGTTKIAVGVQAYILPSSPVGLTGQIVEVLASQNAYIDIGHVSFGSLTATLQGTTTCKNSSGTILTIAGSVMNMPSSGTSSVELKGCPAGYYTFSSKITQTDGISVSTPFTIGQKSTTVTNYPNCAGITACQLQVYYKGAPCTNLIGPCTDWYKNVILAPADYQCYWGAYLLTGMSDCAPLIYQYDPNATYNQDGIAVTSPTLAPPTSTGLTTDTTQVGTSTPTDTGWMGCVPSGWQLLNPFAYAGSTACLIRWSFIPPSTAWSDAVTSVKATWDGSSVGTFTTTMIDIPSHLAGFAGTDNSNCQGPPIVQQWFNDPPVTYYPLSACSQPVQGIAGLAKSIETFGLIFFGGVGIYNTIALGFGLPRMRIGGPEWEQGTLF